MASEPPSAEVLQPLVDLVERSGGVARAQLVFFENQSVYEEVLRFVNEESVDVFLSKKRDF